MRMLVGILFFVATGAFAQTAQIQPRIVIEADSEGRVTVVNVAPRFVTAVRLPSTVNSVVIGDPSQFQVEHSDREPKIVFVKPTSTKAAETNLLISMTNGEQISLLLVNRGITAAGNSVDFLLSYEPEDSFFVAPSGFPSALIGETVNLADSQRAAASDAKTCFKWGIGVNARSETPRCSVTQSDLAQEGIPGRSLENLLEQQESAPLPALYGQRVDEESASRDLVRAGVSRVIDGGQQVIVLFSVVNPTKQAVLLMPPQVQLGGTIVSGKLFRHKKRSTAEQLPVLDFRLSKRRIGPGARADGVVLFERPPYKQSNETLLLQIAESGAVDRPALVPIGFGISTSSEGQNGRAK